MAHQAGPASDEPTAEELASQAVESNVARIVGRPLGGILGVIGFGLGIAALGSGAHAAAVGWFTLGAFGFAMCAVGSDAARSAG